METRLEVPIAGRTLFPSLELARSLNDIGVVALKLIYRARNRDIEVFFEQPNRRFCTRPALYGECGRPGYHPPEGGMVSIERLRDSVTWHTYDVPCTSINRKSVWRFYGTLVRALDGAEWDESGPIALPFRRSYSGSVELGGTTHLAWMGEGPLPREQIVARGNCDPRVESLTEIARG